LSQQLSSVKEEGIAMNLRRRIISLSRFSEQRFYGSGGSDSMPGALFVRVRSQRRRLPSLTLRQQPLRYRGSLLNGYGAASRQFSAQHRVLLQDLLP
jgi:hypothetical protein